MTQPLLIEIGVEELPAVPLLKIVKNIEDSWKNLLDEYFLQSEFEFLYTPRRLVLKHGAMPLGQADSMVELVGPPLAAALKDGVVTQAGEGFAKKCGVAFDELGRTQSNGREVLYFKQQKEGLHTRTLLQEMLEKWIASMAFGKMMRWGSREDEFIRPIRWLQVRLGDEVVPVELFGVKSDRKTYLHRMANFDAVLVENIADYDTVLKNGAVILDPRRREEIILSQFDALETEYGIFIERDSVLLAEVVAITENPKALFGSFDESFLELPPEVIITSMKEHQRYFAVYEGGNLTNKFVVISNAHTDDYGKVLAGNERVLRPRLADAMFFYYNDLRHGLLTEGLEKIQFMDGLGSLSDKIHRENEIALRLLMCYIDRATEESGKSSAELEGLMDRAIQLAKADLNSEMVYEFTELQGLMGYYYAVELGEDLQVCTAIKEQYMPVGEGAELPSTIFSSIVAMSIKLDTLLGLFSIGKIPTGSKDPFALRRAVNGIVRIVTANDLSFDIDEVIEMLKGAYAPFDVIQLREFIIERITKSLDANPSVIAAVLASGERDINEISKKVSALGDIVSSEDFKEYFSTFKRVANISKEIDLQNRLDIDTELFEHDAEVSLYNAYEKILFQKFDDHKSRLKALFALKPQLDTYFDAVMVNAEAEELRTNRRHMIGSIYKTLRSIADIKEISI